MLQEVYSDENTVIRVCWEGDRIVRIEEVELDRGSSSNFGLKNDYVQKFYFWTREKMDNEIAADLSGWNGESVCTLNCAEHFIVL